MSVTLNDLDKIAHLARLSISGKEKEKFLGQVNGILEYIEKLNEVDTTGVEPISNSLDIVNVVRNDIKKESLSPSDTLENAPAKKGDFFRVPKVIAR